MVQLPKAERDEAFATFMAEATPSLMRTAFLLTGSADLAAELVQAALVKTYAAWPRVRPGSALAYSRRILVNQRIDVWRRTRREIPVAEVPAPVGPAPGAPGEGAVEDRDSIVRLLACLPERQRKVVVLRYYQDLPETATAEALGVSVGAVKSAASRGLATLRAQLATSEGGVR
jgi:RNA polymerase sigma-70 factor (sigma-E family)